MTDRTIISIVMKQGVMSNVATLFWGTILQVQRSFSNQFAFLLWTECKHAGSIWSLAAPHESLLVFPHETV